jgi:uncharacterized membrane protein
MFMQSVVDFVTDYPIPVIVGLLLVIFAFAFLRAIFKIVFLLIFVALVLVFGFNYSPEKVIDLGKQGIAKTVEIYNDTLKATIESEMKDAKISHKDDGSYTIQTKSLRITGVKGDPDATIHFKGHAYKMPIKNMSKIAQNAINSAAQDKK